MSPNNLTPHTDSEQTNAPDYAVQTEDAIELANNRNPMQRLVLMQNFLDIVYGAADQAAIKTSGGDVINGDMMNDRLRVLISRLNSPRENEDALALIPRGEGLRDSFQKLMLDEATAGPLMQAITDRLRAAEKKSETLSLAEFQEDIADEAMKDAPVVVMGEADVAIAPRDVSEHAALLEAAQRINNTPVVEQSLAAVPETTPYDAIKQEMAALSAELSDLDKYYLDIYVEAGPTRYDEQGVAATKFSSELRDKTDLIEQYQALYDQKQKLLGL